MEPRVRAAGRFSSGEGLAVRVLVVEDTDQLRRRLCAALRVGGYAVDSADDGHEARWLLDAGPYDVGVLDVMLPGVDGLTILRHLRRRENDLHVILLTARAALEDRLAGLRAGADDYLVKPCAVEELVARVGALTRRAYGRKSPVFQVGPLRVDTGARRVTRAGRANPLTAREYALLEYLACREGNVVTRTEIELHLYDRNAMLVSNVVDSTVYLLRRKLDRPDHPSLIETRRGMGYVLHAGPTSD